MNYTSSYKKTWLAKQRELEMIHGNWEELYAKLPELLGALQSCVPKTVVAAQSVYEGKEIMSGKRIFKRVFWSFCPCIKGFAYCKPTVQVDGYPYTEKMHWRHLGDIRANKPSVAE
ncbi:hypothetical protein GmHk_20G056785 [Glycine max]|nr:hypothetical protein GmHk_20G056785 [Glycine max]